MASKNDGDFQAAGAGTQNGGGNSILMTKEGLTKLKDELGHLKTVRRKEVAERLKEAISYGDLSENAEYEEAKNEQAFVEGRIIELEKQIKMAKIISGRRVSGTQIEIGSTVTVQEKGRRVAPETYTIVGSTEADPIEYKISNESPIGRALIGKMKGDVIEVQAPGGRSKYEILKIS